jgi:hypothetical protein
MSLQANKPYIWLNVPESVGGQWLLSIRCDCGLQYSTEYGIDNAYIIEFTISEDDPVEISRPTTDFNNSIHTKITVKVVDDRDVKGFCTVKPPVD